MGNPHFRIDDGSEAMLRTSAIATAALACALLPAAAQEQPNAAQPKPYKTVAITPPRPFDDPAFDDLRKQLLEISERKDRAALSRLVVTLGFFWDRENGNGADRHKSGVDNLAAALGLSNTDGSGWDTLTTFAGDPTASLSPNHKKTICSPADPGHDRKALDQLIDETDTDPLDWGYPVSPSVEVRAAGDDAAPVIDRLGLYFVRILPDAVTASPSYIHIAMPSGKTGFVAIDAVAPMGNDQICYVPVKSGWKIGGYVGGGDPR
jgi:hypothetical protein